MDQFLQISSLSRAYRSGEVETQALDAVSFGVAPGEFVALMGPSGCGKSTLLNILGFLDSPDAGSYRLREEEVATLSDARLTRLRRAHVGFIFQSFNLIDELNVAENVEVALLYRNVDARRRRVEAVLEQVGLAHRARHRPRQLSGGQQQRVAIARAFAPEPDLILADEPTGNLDTGNGAAVMDLLKGAAAGGTTVIMVTHSALHAAAADRTIRMLDGRIVGETRP
jgi:putative ABC transport system ATP-binding protein